MARVAQEIIERVRDASDILDVVSKYRLLALLLRRKYFTVLVVVQEEVQLTLSWNMKK